MKNCLCIILILFWANTFAQNNFYSSYDYNNQTDGGLIIQEKSKSKEIAVFGRTTSGTRGAKILILDSIGNVISHKNLSFVNNPAFYGGIHYFQHFVGFGAQYNPTEGAADSYLLLLDSIGDTLKTIPSNLAFNDRIHDLYVKTDSTFIAFGFYTDTLLTDALPFIAEIQISGNVNWIKTHNKAGYDETIKNMQATADGGYVFSGTEEENPNGHTDLFLAKVDSIGNLIWKKYYHESFSQRGGHVEVLKDGNYALFGTGYTPHNADRAILKIDTAGNLIWRKKNGTNFDEGYIAGKELPNGNFICAGTSVRMYNNQQIDDVNLSMLDSAGNVLWSRDYNFHGLDINEYVKDIIITSDGGFAMTGFILNAPGGTGNDVFVLKTDANGLITSINSGFYEVTPEMKVYPNPTTGIVNIPYSEGLEKVEVYDLSGSKLHLEFFFGHFDTNSASPNPLSVQKKSTEERNIEINLTNQPNGIYILKFYMKNGEVRTSKVVKQ